MSLPRSSFYRSSAALERRSTVDAALTLEIERIAGEFPAYGYRRITHELRRRGILVNHKRVAPLDARQPRRADAGPALLRHHR